MITREERAVSSSDPTRHEARSTSAVLKIQMRRSVAMATYRLGVRVGVGVGVGVRVRVRVGGWG